MGEQRHWKGAEVKLEREEAGMPGRDKGVPRKPTRNSAQRAVTVSAWHWHMSGRLTFHRPRCRTTDVAGRHSLRQSLVPIALQRVDVYRCHCKAIQTCAAHSSRLAVQAHDLSRARTGWTWTVQPQSVPTRGSGKDRGVFPDYDNLRLNCVWN